MTWTIRQQAAWMCQVAASNNGPTFWNGEAEALLRTGWAP